MVKVPYLSLCLLIFSDETYETPPDHFRPAMKKAMDYQAKEPQSASLDHYGWEIPLEVMSRPFTGEEVFVNDARTSKVPQSPQKTSAKRLPATASSPKSESCVECLDGTRDSRHDATTFETAMDILTEVGIQSASIGEISPVECLDGTQDSRHDATMFENAMDILTEVGIQSASIVEIIGPAESFDIIFKCGDKYGCYEGKTSNFWLLGYMLSEKDMWRCYGDGGRNVPLLRDWVYDE